MYEIMVKSDFSSAHKLRNYHGKCERLHGHNWIIEAAVSSKTLNRDGLLIDFKILKSRLNKILEGLDHTNLNDEPPFKTKNPTSENIAKFIFDMLKKDGITPQRVSVWESDSSCATYFGR
ncbi:MAG: 6-carboxytetrahydropterin synthase QueD [Candidatus Omnitrophica bacterium]|nr:6-carboxytetrahydropterin synthase QueD [Candidatus Omnitrophota bacterium]